MDFVRRAEGETGEETCFLRPSPPTESRLRDEGGKESEALFDFANAR